MYDSLVPQLATSGVVVCIKSVKLLIVVELSANFECVDVKVK